MVTLTYPDDQEIAKLWPPGRDDMCIPKDGKTFTVTVLLYAHPDPIEYVEVCNVDWGGEWLRIYGLQGYAKILVSQINAYQESTPE